MASDLLNPDSLSAVFGVYSLVFPEPQSAARLSGIPADAPVAG